MRLIRYLFFPVLHLVRAVRFWKFHHYSWRGARIMARRPQERECWVSWRGPL